MSEVTRQELGELRKELRNLQLLVGAATQHIASGDLGVRILDHRWKKENVIGRRDGVSSRAQQRISDALGEEIPTLEDLTLIPREQVAGIRGVGPQAMERLDAAMAEHGLDFAESEKVGAA